MILLNALAVLAAVQQAQPLWQPNLNWRPTITWQPTVPRQGSLVIVSAPDAVSGELAGEPLHFESGQALAAVPLDSPNTVTLHVIARHDPIVQRFDVALAVTARHEAGERIQAAERFTPAPDSALLVRLTRERALSRDASARAHAVPRLWKLPFVRPRKARVTSPFGAGREVNGVWRSTHFGLDIAGRTGALVRASNRGVVALVGDFFYGGLSVYVHHGMGLMTSYHHLSRALVSVGDTVARGQIIGRVGTSGRVTGPHLHWGAQYGGVAFDPTDLLQLHLP